jgi:hybrid cluster-associated redox disulfide protein
MSDPAIQPEQTVEHVLRLHPVVATVFVRRRMLCVGCVMAAFETLSEVAAVYGQEPGGFVLAVRSAAVLDAR